MSSEYRRRYFSKVYGENLWNSSESFSGQGSETWVVETLIHELPILFKRLGIASMLDIPCGDFNWMRHVVDRHPLSYIGADIVEPLIAANELRYGNASTTFKTLDIVEDRLPSVDLVFVRDLFIHLSLDLIRKALENIASSDVRYVMLTHDTADVRYAATGNIEIEDGNGMPATHGVNYLFRPVSMTQPPFNLAEPLAAVKEMPDAWNGYKTMSLWSIAQIRDSIRTPRT